MTRPSLFWKIPYSRSTTVFGLLGAGLFALLNTGCANEEIATYTVPKQHVIDQKNVVLPGDVTDPKGDDRMLAAILINGRESWFFKLTGPHEQAASVKGEFRTLLKSVRFDSQSGEPDWSLPAGWSQSPGSEMRYATIEVPAETGPALELSVSKLPLGGWQREEYEMMNINRWRKQLGLEPMGRSQLRAVAEQVAYAGGEATVVDFVGELQPDGMTGPIAGGAPFAGGAGRTAASAPSAAEPVELQFEQPAPWQPAPRQVSRGGISLNYAAAFTAGEGEKQIEITVSEFPAGAGGAILPNINRWRGQIGLEEMTAAELAAAVETLPIGDVEAQYIELRGPDDVPEPKVILAAIAVAKNRTWFFKLMGDAETADREKANFRSFVQSVQFD